MAPESPENDPEPLRFEDAIRRLEGAVAALEEGTIDLDEALARYGEGVRLLARCRALLDEAEQKVALLNQVDEAGNPRTTPFDASATPVELDMPGEPGGTRRKSF
jgi:exodeoxyribonuclease VII small subunit